MKNKKSKTKRKSIIVKNEVPLEIVDKKNNVERNSKGFEKRAKTRNKKSKKENKQIQIENRELKSKLKKVEQENKELKEHLIKIEKLLFELTEKVNRLEEEKRLAEERKEKLKKKIKYIILQLIIAVIIILAITGIVKSKINTSRTGKLSEELKQYVVQVEKEKTLETENEEVVDYDIDFDKLKQLNSDTKGWLKINGVNIDVPVVQSNDNDYYLKYSFDRTRNADGWIFFDYRNLLDESDKNVIIYGHNRKNDMMFSNLVNILNSSWYDNKDNRNISLWINDNKYIYEVFSIYQIRVENYYIQTAFNSDEEYFNFLNTLKSRSIKDFEVDFKEDDSILTLSTCGNNSRYRVVLHAKKI